MHKHYTVHNHVHYSRVALIKKIEVLNHLEVENTWCQSINLISTSLNFVKEKGTKLAHPLPYDELLFLLNEERIKFLYFRIQKLHEFSLCLGGRMCGRD